MKDKAFEPKVVLNASKAAHGICKWVRAMHVYDQVAKVVRPKREELAHAEGLLKTAEEALAVRQKSLQDVLDLLQELENKYEAAQRKAQQLKDDVEKCQLKLDNANTLIGQLKGEKESWKLKSEELEEAYQNVYGDVLISAGVIAYLGVFPANYREDSITAWVQMLTEKNIQCSNPFYLTNIFGDPLQIQEWNMKGLPNDSFSIDNAIIMEKSNRWPLCIDPQIQANTWIRNMAETDRLKIVKLGQENYERDIETGILAGQSVMLENIGETIDPILETLISTKKGTNEKIKLGDREVDMTPEFRFYITTKLPAPHYTPSVCVKLTVLNFLVTQQGLEEQILNIYMEKCQNREYKERIKCIQEGAKCKNKLREVEDKILEQLNNASGDILEDQTLIDTLDDAKKTQKDAEASLEKQEKIKDRNSDIMREYKPVATRVAQLFFVISDLRAVEPMYQYSLEWYTDIFKASLREISATQLLERIKQIQYTFTEFLYDAICRSLFVKDKLLFAFLMCVKIMQGDERVDPEELRFLLTGGVKSEMEQQNPAADWLSDKQWISILELSGLKAFEGFSEDFVAHADGWKEICDSDFPLTDDWPNNFKERITLFQQIVIMRILRPDRCIEAIQQLIREEMGTKFLNPPSFDLDLAYKESAEYYTIIFILSPGTDPIDEIKKSAMRKGFSNKWVPLSLGDGQGEKAGRAIERAASDGTWVVLQNCHLATSWMPTLEKKVAEFQTGQPPTEGFRLFLTSMPSPDFPVTVLQNGIKITNEPPKGLKSNLVRSYMSYDANEYENCNKPKEWRRLLYGLSFFHAVVQERRKFGALGWNIPYEFSMSDLSISFSQLKMFLDDYQEIPWDALKYMVAEANYGGRVTDKWDRRTIKTILKSFYTPKILNNKYTLTRGGEYIIPNEGYKDDYITYIKEKLPQEDLTEVFGLHENANMTSAINESSLILSTCLSLLPRTVSTTGKTQEEIMAEKVDDIQAKIPAIFDIEAAMKRYPSTDDESMNTVLTQELKRFNKLIAIVRDSTSNLKKAIAGTLLLSAELETLGNQIYDNVIPEMWAAVAYPSLKPLGSWVMDLKARLTMLQSWLNNGAPPIFWISGFFFTQSFLTGIMQNYARKHKIAIDTLKWDFKILPADQTIDTFTSPPEDGCYIHGLFLDGARWNNESGYLDEPLPKILNYSVPAIHLTPVSGEDKERKHIYKSPVYKTSSRFGTLSTTGHSTNFVLTIDLLMKPEDKAKHWIKRGVALLCQLNY